MNTTTVRTDFATRLYEKLAASQEGKNLFLSPFSIQLALAMCAVGAQGETRRVMADLIGAPEDLDQQNRMFAVLLRSIQGAGDRFVQLVMANALWGQQGFNLKPEFEKAVARFYSGAVHEVDFRAQPVEAVNRINAWVAEKTHAMIDDLISLDFIDDDMRLIITNAICFKGQWKDKFKEADTREEDWHGPETRTAPMMHQRSDYLYFENSDFQALDLPYKGGQLSMLVVLPTKNAGLGSVERWWVAGDAYRQVTEALKEQKVIVSMPRFRMENEFSLKPVLCELAELAFSDEADFSGIADEPLKISKVVHKAFVEVNEEGTEAAAATAVGISLGSAVSPPREPKVFKADHPFLFFIRDRNKNTVLFSGRLIDPN